VTSAGTAITIPANAPQPAAKPEREKHDDRIQFQPLPDEQRLDDLPFQCCKSQVGERNGENSTDSVERNERHDRQDNERAAPSRRKG
jgi:hypothetical protein